MELCDLPNLIPHSAFSRCSRYENGCGAGFTFLNFTNYEPAEELLGVGNSAVGLLTTGGLLGILSAVPLVPICRWHRTLLFVGGGLNVAAPVVRYLGAQQKSYAWVLASNVMQGNAFGIIGAWPPMLASLQWPERRHALVIAIASLSNYVGGAIGTLATPAVASSAASLLYLFKIQIYISAMLGVLMLTWLWIPPLAGPQAVVRAADEGMRHAADAAHSSSCSVFRAELRHCTRGRAPLQIMLLGVVVGVSIALQVSWTRAMTNCAWVAWRWATFTVSD